jgi:hypothetical protein
MSYDSWLERPYQDAYAASARLEPFYERFGEGQTWHVDGEACTVEEVEVTTDEDEDGKYDCVSLRVRFVDPDDGKPYDEWVPASDLDESA